MKYTKGESEAEYHVQQSFPCGCQVRHYKDESYGITYCTTHKAAPEMYKALTQIASCESYGPGDVVDIARKALTKVERK